MSTVRIVPLGTLAKLFRYMHSNWLTTCANTAYSLIASFYIQYPIINLTPSALARETLQRGHTFYAAEKMHVRVTSVISLSLPPVVR